MSSSASYRTRPKGARSQRGIALVLVTVAALAIIAMAGLALDMGYVFINKTRLQNAVDAAALSGAKVLQQGLGVPAATTAASNEFDANFPGSGATLSIETSNALSPFAPGTTPAKFLRVTASSLSVVVRLARVVPGVGPSLDIGGSAVAGPMPLGEICSVVPVVLCAADPTSADTDCSDGSCYGFTFGPGEEITFAGCHPKGNEEGCGETPPIGSGNFGFLDLEKKGGGAADLAHGLAGDGAACVGLSESSIYTEPGAMTGQVERGINTRFGLYDGNFKNTQAQYPPDVVVTHPMFFDAYETCLSNPATCAQTPGGVPHRRVVAVPVADCTTLINGSKPADLIGIACFFLTKPANGGDIYGQLVSECEATGNPGPGPLPNGGPSKIVLYKDERNTKS